MLCASAYEKPASVHAGVYYNEIIDAEIRRSHVYVFQSLSEDPKITQT